MNDFDYARMIEIPINSCDVSVKPRAAAKFRFRRGETLKKTLMEKINSDAYEAAGDERESSVEITTKKAERRARRKNRFSVDIVTAQAAVVAILVMTILLTNIFWADSGINTLLAGVFSSGAEKVEDKAYAEFAPGLPSRTSEITLKEGVMTFSGEGSVYPICDGKVAKIADLGDKLEITIEFSPSFSAVISGVDFAYYGVGDAVYRSVPVCYSDGGEVDVRLYSDGQLISDYMLDNGSIVWQS